MLLTYPLPVVPEEAAGDLPRTWTADYGCFQQQAFLCSPFQMETVRGGGGGLFSNLPNKVMLFWHTIHARSIKFAL